MPKRAPVKLTLRKLAQRLKKSHTAVGRWARDADWPFGPGPWDAALVPKIEQWRARTLAPAPDAPSAPQPGPAALNAERTVNILLKSERAKLLKLKREVEEGKYVLRADVEQGRLERIGAVRAALARLPRLAERLVGMDAEQMAIVLAGEVEQILHAFSREDAAPG
jgi:hypothetical protein